MSFRILFLPKQRSVNVPAGTTVLEAGIQCKAGISHKCGGHGSCGTCRVQMDLRAAVNPPTRIERIKLSEDQLAEGCRLACQVVVGSDLTVQVSESILARVVREQLAELQRHVERHGE